METVKRKIIIKNNSVYRSYQAQLIGWIHVIIFTQINHSWTDKGNAGRRTFLTFFKKNRILDWMIIINFENTASHKYLVQTFKSYEWLDQKWLNIHFLFLFKNDIQAKLCFENSSCKRLPFNDSANSSWAWQVCALLTFQLCMVCGSSFWIKVKSASETVFGAFNFSSKLLGVLSKQLA